MSIVVPIELNVTQPGGITLAQLCATILSDEAVPLRRRGEVVSAIRSLAKAFGKPMEAVSAQPIDLRIQLKDMTAAMAGQSEGRWRNVRSLVQFALTRIGLCTVAGRYDRALSPAWSKLIKALEREGDRFKLAHLGRYCDAAGIRPDQVDDAVMDRLLDDLLTRSLSSEPERAHRDAIIAWNRSVDALPAWPQRRLAVPDNRRGYSMPWDSFPPSLKADVDTWLRRLAGTDPFEETDFNPLRPRSLITRGQQIHQYVSALALSGVQASDLTCLADVVTPERMAIGLRFFWDRSGGKKSLHGAQIAGVVLSIARHWVKLDQPKLDRLKLMARKITSAATGMTEQNKARLRPLEDPQTLRSLLNLPDRIRAEVVGAGAPTRQLALQMQTAVAIELLIMAPVRIFNLVNLQMGRHLIRGRDQGLTLVLVEDEVKNRMAHEAPLPTPTVRLIDLYCARYRPLLGDAETPWLFPGQNPLSAKCDDTVRQQIQNAIRRRCGLTFNPHLFRHLAGYIVLLNNPAAHGQVQRILGHKNINTTLQFYAGLETKAALQHFDNTVEKIRGATPMPAPQGRVRRPRS